ncbi:hypothetical protein [Streptomyces sp. NPDC059943]|uniref:hypothetical protein n=1 Tax=Streptomyces sp. NPDC059943 TaxID=3347010 RepID=UPI003665C8C5
MKDTLDGQAQQLYGLVERARLCRREMSDEAERQSLPLTDPARPYGVLVIEATRLLEELERTTDVLGEHWE